MPTPAELVRAGNLHRRLRELLVADQPLKRCDDSAPDGSEAKWELFQL